MFLKTGSPVARCSAFSTAHWSFFWLPSGWYTGGASAMPSEHVAKIEETIDQLNALLDVEEPEQDHGHRANHTQQEAGGD